MNLLRKLAVIVVTLLAPMVANADVLRISFSGVVTSIGFYNDGTETFLDFELGDRITGTFLIDSGSVDSVNCSGNSCGYLGSDKQFVQGGVLAEGASSRLTTFLTRM